MVQEALALSQKPDYLPLYYLANRELGEDLFHMEVRDFGDDVRMLAGTDRRVACPPALFHWRLKKRIDEKRLLAGGGVAEIHNVSRAEQLKHAAL